MRKYILILLLSFLLIGCVEVDTPQNNSAFSEHTTINNLIGVYKNLGEDGTDDNTNTYLSEIIWSNRISVQHKSIDRIIVEKKNFKSLFIKAMNKNIIMKKQLFTEGKDFKIKDGTIVLMEKSEAAIVQSAGAFIMSEKKTIGLDENGNGKYKFRTSGAGLLAMFLPVAIHIQKEIRFKRIE